MMRAQPDAASEGLRPEDVSVLLQRQTEVLELVAAAAPLKETLDAIIIALEDLIGGARCSILIVDSSGSVLRHGAAPNLPSVYLSAIDGIQPGPKAGSCGTAAFFGEQVVVSDVRTDDRWVDYRDAAVHSGLISCWSSPIADPQGVTVGTFAVYHAEPHWPTPRERRLVDRFTYLASVAIEHSRLLGDIVESEELFRRSFEDNPAGEALLGLNKNFERANTAFARLSGYHGDELVGLPLEAVLQIDAATEERIRNALADARTHCITQQMRLRCKNGDVRPVEAAFSLICSRDGTPARLALSLVDLTERLAADAARRARHEAEVARQIAEDHSSAKSALLTSVSHEVRTPLQAIKGFTELLSTLDLDESRRNEALARINFAADHVLDLVTDVLDISRVEAGVLPLHLEPVKVDETVREIVHLLDALVAERHASVHLAVDPCVVVLADRNRLRQVLLNIISNALRHGRGSGTVQITAPETSPSVSIAISDDGPGIPADYLPRMFTPFARANGTDERNAPIDGYGLGLMLSHGLITAMNGELIAGNLGTGGAIFTVTLPSAEDQS
ncbi:ATP-binding protein [Rhodococcus koreensis]